MKPLISILQWFDTEALISKNKANSESLEWTRLLPFIGLHLACFAVFYVGFSWVALWIAVASYFIRMFAITAFYHRYFSHRTFKTNRFWQFCFALLGTTSCQRGPLWWAAHHREHHKKSDTEEDIHSPVKNSFLWSHIGWFCCEKNFKTDYKAINDFAKYPELIFLNRFDMLAPFIYAIFMYYIGVVLGGSFLGLEITGGQAFVWGFLVSTIILFHATVSINSLAHIFGKRRFKTQDNSRNNFWLAIITLGEGWHNNHHYYPNSINQGFFWWEVDVSFYILKLMSWLGIIKDLKNAPKRVKLLSKK